jgi:AcrR family transcriptional regulator
MSERIKPRGRPRSFDRADALHKAMLLFWRHGYEGTSIADLTGAMGVTPPTLYAAFGSKEKLYREALRHYAKDEGSDRSIPGGSNIRAEVEAYLLSCARNFSDPAKPGGCMVSTGSLQCAVENQPAKDAAGEMRARALQSFTARLRQAKKQGELRDEAEPAVLARYYAAIIQGMSVQASDGASRAELDAMVDVAMGAWPGKARKRT